MRKKIVPLIEGLKLVDVCFVYNIKFSVSTNFST